MEKMTKEEEKRITVKIYKVLGVILSIFVLISSLTIVKPGHSGVVITLGKVSDTVLTEGIHFRPPFISDIKIINNQVVRADVDSVSASKDLQTITVNTAINYRVLNLSSSELYKNVGKKYEDVIIKPAVQESVKAITAKYNAEELITKRQEVGQQMKDLLSAKINAYGFEVQNFNITNFAFSEGFTQAIESKQVAQQSALKAEQDLIRIKTEAKQQIEKAKAEAETLRVKKAQISEEMLRMTWIEKWDGKLPTYMGGEGMNIYIPQK